MFQEFPYHLNVNATLQYKYKTQRILSPGDLNWVQHCVSRIGLFVESKTLFTWSGGPRSSGVSFFCFVSPRAWKQKKHNPTRLGSPTPCKQALRQENQSLRNETSKLNAKIQKLRYLSYHNYFIFCPFSSFPFLI